MNTRSAGMDTKPVREDARASKERTPQIQTQLEALRLVIERLYQVVSKITSVFRPVLAEAGGEKAAAEAPNLLRGDLAPLAEDLAGLEDRIEIEVKRLHSLVRRCEV